VKTLSALDVAQSGDIVTITASAPSFLHHQVRSLAGVIKVVGTGKWMPEDAKAALEARDRAACAQVAPACGLSFMKVDYPEDVLVQA
jgi:tRNA pseudouridine38-40 synthase